jgi:nicotinate-nucleotide adenylyltransferase
VAVGGERIGIFGGTFDPVHIGHLAAAVNARHALSLDRMLMVVANIPRQKADLHDITPPEDRYAVVEAAVQGVEGIEASRLELDRGGRSYTADTVAALADLHPGAELFVVVGSDLVPSLSTWERVEEVRDQAVLAVVVRPGAGVSLPPAPWRCEVVEVPALDVSSTDLRGRVATGRPIDVLVPPPAVREIRRRGLYAA